MQLSIDIEQHKSTLFLDFLKLLPKDNMINDFWLLPPLQRWNAYKNLNNKITPNTQYYCVFVPPQESGNES